ncbi:MAG: lipoprotein signal peptidase [Bacteroidales bacterium]
MSRSLKCILIILVILIVDQVIKVIVKTNMTLYEQNPVFGNWFIIHFVENKGMAFGMNLPGNYGKIMLSLFRLVAIVAISFYLRHLIKLKAHAGLLITMSLILAGAIGNMIDSAFYGMIFSESSSYEPAIVFPESGGYETFLHGKVVDMFYFPIINGVYPNWFPSIGGQSFTFFRPVFNIADASISIAVVILLFRQRKYFEFMQEIEEESEPSSEKTDTPKTKIKITAPK